MITRCILSILTIVCQGILFAQRNAVTVFTSGADGYKNYRIPAIISLPNGNLLAFAEGRVNGSADFGDINIVMKHSADQGKTWSFITTVVDYNSLQAGNPAPVIDLTDPEYPDGRIFLFYNTGNNKEGEIRQGNGFREVRYKTSTDGGFSWSRDVNITSQVHRLQQPLINPEYNFIHDWRSYANTPGHAMQFTSGKYKGRILVAANHSEGDPKSNFEDYFAHTFYTDDHGKTFKLGQSLPIAGSNESTAAELTHGSLMLNARNQKGHIKCRIIALSSNGGETWDSSYFEKNLPDPVCEGSLIRIGNNAGKNILAFSNAADTTSRNNLTLRISFDNGCHWPLWFPVDKSASSSKKVDYTAYSDLVKISDDEIGILYERDNYSQIVFKIINWSAPEVK